MVLLLLAVAVLFLSRILQPGTDAVHLGDISIPRLCTFHLLTGWDCPGCGLTRSFVWLAHFDLGAALEQNVLGPPLFAGVILQVPWRVWRLAQIRTANQIAPAAPSVHSRTPFQL
jgi:hypothetical protein